MSEILGLDDYGWSGKPQDAHEALELALSLLEEDRHPSLDMVLSILRGEVAEG